MIVPENQKSLSTDEISLICTIKENVKKENKDNISRTKAYDLFFRKHPEIKWSFLAGMVSRNAGWNMCDLKGPIFENLLSAEYRHLLFLTYEQANSYIFSDAFSQLLLYHYSIKWKKPLFHLSPYLLITNFMENEWSRFWVDRNEQRLVHALIINEQNIIEDPVIKKGPYTDMVFDSILFKMQDLLHFSTVLFPTNHGELYGASVSNFQHLGDRIELGKRLAKILFTDHLFVSFFQFSQTNEPTGSRIDYERYSIEFRSKTPFLRTTYPVISHAYKTDQWDLRRKTKRKWFKETRLTEEILITDWYYEKQKQLQAAAVLKQLLT